MPLPQEATTGAGGGGRRGGGAGSEASPLHATSNVTSGMIRTRTERTLVAVVRAVFKQKRTGIEPLSSKVSAKQDPAQLGDQRSCSGPRIQHEPCFRRIRGSDNLRVYDDQLAFTNEGSR